MSIREILRVFSAIAWLIAAIAPGVARAQDAPPAAEAEVFPEGEVAIRVETFGVGNVVRAGDWAGIRVALRDTAAQPRTVSVRLHLEDSDGDTALHSRVVTLNPGQELGTWLYARMAWDLVQGSVLRVSVAEAIPAEDGTVTIGRQFSWKPIAAPSVLPPQKSMGFVIGASPLSMDQYSVTLRDREHPAAAQEAMQVIAGLSPQSVPDVWTGLGAGEVVLWSEGDPASLGPERAAAIREWVHRGGHLVIVIPAVGNAWTSPSNPLADLLPVCRFDRLSEVDMSPYRLLLSGSTTEREALRLPLHRFVIGSDTPVSEATPLITGPHGVVAARRLVGTGMVTLIGLDLTSRRITAGGWIRADAFWSRILGRRGATPTQAEVEAANSQRVFGTTFPSVWLDERIMPAISKSREAGLGVLLAMVLFAAYWVIAGPLGFYALRARGLERHAWLGFVLVAGLFTFVAWTGAQSLRPKREEAWHLTILDHVYGQPVQRARTFVSVLLPQYGDQRVRLGQDGTDERWNQALTPLTDPAATSSATFPDARPYVADVRAMTELFVPARSTIKTFQGDWLGGPRWSMPRPLSAEDAPRIDSTGRLVGRLTHGLPTDLQNPRVILVTGQVAEGTVGRTTATSPPVVGKVYAWAEPAWSPGATLELAKFQPGPQAMAYKRLADLVPKVSIMNQSLPASVKDDDLDEAIALYGVLEQPSMDRSTLGSTTIPANVQRRMTHTLDLSKWMTQPCLIIIGTVENEANPVPMSVDGHALDGKERPSSGRTIVRWVYPLDASALIVGGGAGASDDELPSS